ncbi:hypothetical protein KSP39_PZI018758 [Platanthera zijinensis]|uniref:Uncharacterized protein n=1 Tax=Platanthera zijinensis TaxID=2320716 RepID=A0AAP0FYP3_9ASPA
MPGSPYWPVDSLLRQRSRAVCSPVGQRVVELLGDVAPLVARLRSILYRPKKTHLDRRELVLRPSLDVPVGQERPPKVGGVTYGGQYFDDDINGFGVYHFANGQCYEGSWHKGKWHGFGSYTLKDGEALSGEWDSETLKNYLPLADSNVDRAVQCARNAWMEWLRAPRIDEQVNKAVEEAYREASAAEKASIKAVQSRLVLERSARRQKFSLPTFI